MPDYKVILVFQQRNNGWSETYYRNLPQSNLEAVANGQIPLAQKRAALLGKEATLQAIRVSREGLANDSFITYLQMAGVEAQPAATVDDSLLIRMSNADFTRHRNLYLRGVFRSIIDAGGNFVNNQPLFMTAFQNYRGELENTGYYWPSVDPASRVRKDLVGYVSDANDLVTFTVNENVFPADKVGATVRVRVSGLNGGSVLNTSLLVKVLDQKTAKTIQPYATFPFKFGGKLLYSVTNNADVVGVRAQKIVSRQTGSPLLASVGRRSARARG